MAEIITTLPSTSEQPPEIALADIIKALPDTLPIPVDLWMTGKTCVYGKAWDLISFTGNFEAYEHGFPPPVILQLFSSLMNPLGLRSTIDQYWRIQQYYFRLYDKGELIIDKATMAYTRLPTAIPVFMGASRVNVLAKVAALPTVPFDTDIYLTGSLAYFDFGGDVDLIFGKVTDMGEGKLLVERPTDYKTLKPAIQKYFSNLFGCKVDADCLIMTDRETPERPHIRLLPLYKAGTLCLQP